MAQIHRFFIPSLTKQDTQAQLIGENAKIASSVLRLKTSDPVEIINGQGLIAKAKIKSLASKEVICHIEKIDFLNPVQPYLHIGVSLLKGEKNQLIVQKLTEIGVQSISFFESEHSVSKVKKTKLDKFEKIALEAIRQSGNAYLPELNFFDNLDACMGAFRDSDIKGVLHEQKNQTKPFVTIMNEKDKTYHLMIGPEGGFSKNELALMHKKGYVAYGLSNHVLRAETAAIVAASSLLVNFYA